MGSVGKSNTPASFSYTQEELSTALEDWQTHYFTEIREIDSESGTWNDWKTGYDEDEAAQIEKDQKILTEFLKNSPKYEGEVERGLAFDSKASLNKFLKQNKVGDIVTSKSMASWSSKKGEGASYGGDQALDMKDLGYGAVVVMHKVTSQGVAIEEGGQHEKILPKGIQNKVLKVTKGKYTNHGQSIPRVDIYYEELKNRRKR